jgi:hypothetical protein
MALINISFAAMDKIAYIVRFKEKHGAKAVDEGHSDCILPSGAPVGYFGDAAVGGNGIVYGYSLFRSRRAHYVNLTDAMSKPCKSTMLVMQVGTLQAMDFRSSWLSMRAKTDGFTIVGNNCSTHASRALHAAGVIKSASVSGIDTPDNLFEQIIEDKLAPWRSYSGYLSFTPIQAGGDDLMLSYSVDIEPTEVPTDSAP